MIYGSSRVAPEKAVFRPALAMSFMPGISEMQMTKALSYGEQLKHPNWQRRRLEILQRDNFCCQVCYDNETTLHVHHKRYVKGRMAWEYTDRELVTLCEQCHGLEHEASDSFKELIAYLPVDGPSCSHNARGLLAGWANGMQGNDFSQHFEDEPFNYVLGEVANKLSLVCQIGHLMALAEALGSRDRYTVRAALDQFVLDLKSREASTPPPIDPSELI